MPSAKRERQASGRILGLTREQVRQLEDGAKVRLFKAWRRGQRR